MECFQHSRSIYCICLYYSIYVYISDQNLGSTWKNSDVESYIISKVKNFINLWQKLLVEKLLVLVVYTLSYNSVHTNAAVDTEELHSVCNLTSIFLLLFLQRIIDWLHLTLMEFFFSSSVSNFTYIFVNHWNQGFASHGRRKVTFAVAAKYRSLKKSRICVVVIDWREFERPHD